MYYTVLNNFTKICIISHTHKILFTLDILLAFRSAGILWRWIQILNAIQSAASASYTRKHAKTHVKCEHINLIPYFARKCASICARVWCIFQCKELLEAFAMPLFLALLRNASIYLHLHRYMHHYKVFAALQKNAHSNFLHSTLIKRGSTYHVLWKVYRESRIVLEREEQVCQQNYHWWWGVVSLLHTNQ